MLIRLTFFSIDQNLFKTSNFQSYEYPANIT